MAARDASMTVPSCARTGAAVGPCRGTGGQHGLRLGDFLVRGGEALVQRWNLVRAHAEAALEARLASSDGRRQRVVVTGDKTTRRGAPPRPNGLDPRGVGNNDEPLHEVGHEVQVSGRFLAQVHHEVGAPQADRLDARTGLDELHGVPVTTSGVAAEVQLQGLLRADRIVRFKNLAHRRWLDHAPLGL